jgi:cyclopropane-fatty-acyl-phospholipid synthase
MAKIFDNILKALSERNPRAAFAVELWDGTVKRYGRGPEKFTIKVRRENSIKKILNAGTLGFGEEYMAGNIIIDGALQDMIAMYDHWRELLGRLSLGAKARTLLDRVFSQNSIFGARKNIARHYDLGNDFYSLWLDPTLTYSCAYFKSENETLQTAQINKYDHICRKLWLKPGELLVDIGCGWGGMMFYAAKNYGVKCVGYTLSKNQFDYVSEKIKNEGWGDLVKIYLDDYRKAKGVFDKFVSIGMFEHVGKRYYPVFFGAVKKLLKPGGIGVLHTIGSKTGQATDPWIAKYIFPGGYIPALGTVCEKMSAADLIFYDVEDLRPHYAKTLDLWIANFENNQSQIQNLISKSRRDAGAAEKFVRMWRLYLNASAVSFKTGANRLYQIIFSNGINNSLPLTRDYIYSV